MDAVDGAVGALKKIEVPLPGPRPGQEAYLEKDEPEFVNNVMRPMLAQQGDKLPVSAFRRTGSSPRPPPSTKKGVLPSTCRSGSRRTASSATSAPLFAPMRSFDRCWPRRRPQGCAQGLCDRGGQGKGAQGAAISDPDKSPRLHGLRQLRRRSARPRKRPLS